MREMMIEGLSLSIPSFFAISCDCHYLHPSVGDLSKKYLLPDTSEYFPQEEFAKVYLGWNTEGLIATFDVQTLSCETSSDYRKGDSVELFIDTRDLKEKSFPTKFCHHFVFLPTEQGIGMEVTRFRADDMHPLCDGSELIVQTHFQKKGYRLHISLLHHCLHGYDPERIDHMGFTYRVNRSKGEPQVFSVSPDEYSIEQNPSLWASLKLVK